jgi:hypothetical protein
VFSIALANLDGDCFLRQDRVLGMFRFDQQSVVDTFNVDSADHVRNEISLDMDLEKSLIRYHVIKTSNDLKMESYLRELSQQETALAAKQKSSSSAYQSLLSKVSPLFITSHHTFTSSSSQQTVPTVREEEEWYQDVNDDGDDQREVVTIMNNNHGDTKVDHNNHHQQQQQQQQLPSNEVLGENEFKDDDTSLSSSSSSSSSSSTPPPTPQVTTPHVSETTRMFRPRVVATSSIESIHSETSALTPPQFTNMNLEEQMQSSSDCSTLTLGTGASFSTVLTPPVVSLHNSFPQARPPPLLSAIISSKSGFIQGGSELWPPRRVSEWPHSAPQHHTLQNNLTKTTPALPTLVGVEQETAAAAQQLPMRREHQLSRESVSNIMHSDGSDCSTGMGASSPALFFFSNNTHK